MEKVLASLKLHFKSGRALKDSVETFMDRQSNKSIERVFSGWSELIQRKQAKIQRSLSHRNATLLKESFAYLQQGFAYLKHKKDLATSILKYHDN